MINKILLIIKALLFPDDYFPMFGSPFRKALDNGHQVFAVFRQFVLDGDRLCKIDATPMEGFDSQLLDELLGLKNKD